MIHRIASKPPIQEDDEIKRMFESDVHDKKRTGLGIYGRSGSSRGSAGRVRLPSDNMSKAEKKIYTGPSEVRIEYMDISVMPLADFYALPHEEAKKQLILYRKQHSTKDIKIAWGKDGEPMNDPAFYAIMKKLGIPTNQKINEGRAANKLLRKGEEMTDQQQQKAYAKSLPAAPPAPAFGIEMHGEFNAPDVVARLMKVAALLEQEPGKFTIDLTILEVKAPTKVEPQNEEE